MDTLDTYWQCIEKVLRDYAQLPYAYGEIEREATVLIVKGSLYVSR
jgi:hypothetical protein